MRWLVLGGLLLTVGCQCGSDVAPAKEDCSDGVDNDGNRLTDCEDPGCDVSPACPEQSNRAPVAGDDGVTTAEDTLLAIASADLLANDSDPDGSPLTITAAGDSVNGTVQVAEATITFTPAADFSGTTSFTYTVSDGALTDTGTVTVTVTASADAPVAGDDSASVAEDTALDLQASTLLANDEDVEGDPLTISGVSKAVNGSVTLSGTMVTFTPAVDFNGEGSFEYTVSDGTSSDSGKVTVMVSPVQDAPVASADTAGTAEDMPLTLAVADLLANDTDVDADALTVTAVGGAVNGTVTLAGSTITFTPDADYNGAATFEYTVSDGMSTDTAVVAVAVAAVNDAPVATNDTATTDEDTALSIPAATLAANDNDVDGDALTITAVSNAVNGTVTLSGSSVTFTPDANFNGAAGFEYTVSDGTVSATGAVAVIVSGVNDGPVALNDTGSTDEDTAWSSPASALLANDADIDGDALTVTAVGNAMNGTVALSGNTVTFTPSANFNGAAGFSYTVSDASSSATAVVAITVNPVNDSPVPTSDSQSTDEDTPLTVPAGALLANDTDVDGDTLTVTVVGAALNGAVTLSGTTITFTPNSNFNGAASFEYTVSDGVATASAMVSVTVAPVNDPPVATADAQSTDEDTALSLSTSVLLANDSDLDGDALTVTAVGSAVNGTVALSGTTVTFTPSADFNGVASFGYTISDGAASATATATVTVNAVNDAPVAVSDSGSTDEDTVFTASSSSLLANDSDVDGDTLTITAVGSAVNGTVSLSGSTVTFTPTADFNGAASFEYTVSDGTASVTGVVAMTVNAVNDAPVAVTDSASTGEDTVLTLSAAAVLGNDSDVDGDVLTLTAAGGAQNGTVTLMGSTLTFTPDADFNGSAGFDYTISDGVAFSTGRVDVTVIPANDAPIASDDAAGTNEDVALTIPAATLLSNDSDVDGDALTITAVSNPVNGTVTVAGTNVTFTPAANFSGSASFEYTLSDGTTSDTAVVSITVSPVNDAPVAADDNVATVVNTALTLAASTLLANDSDVEGGPLSITAVANAVNGTVSLSGTSITFTPAANFEGDATFEYTVSDGVLTDTGLVTVAVVLLRNGSFESQNYAGWTLTESSGNPQYGYWAIASHGQSLTSSTSLYDFTHNVTGTSGCLSTAFAVSATDGNYVAVQVQTGPERHRMYQTVTIPTNATTLSWEMAYRNNTGFDANNQYLAIHLRNPSTDAILATLYKTEAGVHPTTIPMSAFSVSIASFAGQTVRLDVDAQVLNTCFTMAFDNFRIQ